MRSKGNSLDENSSIHALRPIQVQPTIALVGWDEGMHFSRVVKFALIAAWIVAPSFIRSQSLHATTGHTGESLPEGRKQRPALRRASRNVDAEIHC